MPFEACAISSCIVPLHPNQPVQWENYLLVWGMQGREEERSGNLSLCSDLLRDAMLRFASQEQTMRLYSASSCCFFLITPHLMKINLTSLLKLNVTAHEALKHKSNK